MRADLAPLWPRPRPREHPGYPLGLVPKAPPPPLLARSVEPYPLPQWPGRTNLRRHRAAPGYTSPVLFQNTASSPRSCLPYNRSSDRAPGIHRLHHPTPVATHSASTEHSGHLWPRPHPGFALHDAHRIAPSRRQRALTWRTRAVLAAHTCLHKAGPLEGPRDGRAPR